MPQSRVVCFEKEESARRILTRFASEHDVASRVEIHGAATPRNLERVLEPRTPAVVICDVEGTELELLDPFAVPALRSADILVELHDFVHPGIASILRDRFQATHRITEVPARSRRAEDWTSHVELDRDHKLALLDERRPDGMRWLWMVRRTDGSGASFDRDATRPLD